MNPQFEERDPHAPVGYDPEGRPLYAAPQMSPEPAVVQNPQPSPPQPEQVETIPDTMPRVVHLVRNPSPEKVVIPEEVKRKHDESVLRYPGVNLSEAEYVIRDVKRHPIGIIGPIMGGGVTVLLLAIVLAIYPVDPGKYNLPGFGLAALVFGSVMILIGLGVLMLVWVYLQNRFYLTNESVIQNIQESLFSRREQTINLANIEDASYSKHGIFQTFFDYGMIRLSTEGEETTYRMTYVSHPKQEIDALTNAVEAFKNGRPVEDD